MKKHAVRMTALVGASLLTLVGCTADPGASPTTADPTTTEIPAQQVDQALHDQLPENIKATGVINAVNRGSVPPYDIVGSDGTFSGASADIGSALGEILGVEITEQTADGLASVLTGIQAGRYDIDFGPVGDVPERHGGATFVDWVQEFVVFAVAEGNPKNITDLDSTCGMRVAVQSAASAEDVITQQSAACTAAGQPAVEIQSYKDQPSSVLAVQSGRADAFFSSQAPLTYFVAQSDGALELAGVGESNGFGTIYQGAVVAAGSPLADIVLAALQQLKENGTYEAIMTKWGLTDNQLDSFGINLSAQ